MKPLQKISVESQLPGALAPLTNLGRNLRWSWYRPTHDLFRKIDPQAWAATGGNPVALLPNSRTERLQELAADPAFLAEMNAATQELDTFLTEDRWYQRTFPGQESTIAYFSMEFGITPTLPIYSGGLGILAGDHLKAASELGVPLVGIGLLYRWGYFSQQLDREGRQQEVYRQNDPARLAVTPVRDAAGEQLTVPVSVPGGRSLRIAVWKAAVGRVTLLLLDSDVDGNDPDLRETTDRLYGGDSDHRIRQEIVLGIAGVRAVQAWSALEERPAPEVWHLNEGHAGFSGLERVGQLMGQGLEFEAALTQVRAATVFTTHTPVPAGIDRFDAGSFGAYLDGDEHGISRLIPHLPVHRALELGREHESHLFNMAHLGFRIAQRSNGVSQLHGDVSRRMFQNLFPGFDADEIPIGAVTNGVHLASWTTRETRALYATVTDDPHLAQTTDWSMMQDLSDADIESARSTMRAELVESARTRVRSSWLHRGADAAELAWTREALDPDVLTIGFARRVSTYKRLTLMLSNPDRLRRILLDPQRPVQIVVAGKAHPADRPGKEFLQELVRFADEHDVRHRVVFLPDYDIELGLTLTAGADVWLNNPVRPEEASGTSGMKAALNGGLTFSISDGWWDEMRDDAAGWTIPTVVSDDTQRRDALESEALYDLLEHEIAPLFYARDEAGNRSRWNDRIRASLTTIAPRVTATRMLQDYVTDLYRPAVAAGREFVADPELAPSFTAFRRELHEKWDHVHVSDVRLADRVADGVPTTGEELTVSCAVELDGLAPDSVRVEALLGPTDEAGEIVDPRVIHLDPREDGRWGSTFRISAPGDYGCTVRVRPHHPVLTSPAELGMVRLPGQ